MNIVFWSLEFVGIMSLLLVFLYTIAERTWLERRGIRRLTLQGRSIDGQTATSRVRAGLGRIFRNRSTLRGEWWYLDNSNVPKEYILRYLVEERGQVILVDSEEVRNELESLRDSEVLVDGFCSIED